MIIIVIRKVWVSFENLGFSLGEDIYMVLDLFLRDEI